MMMTKLIALSAISPKEQIAKKTPQKIQNEANFQHIFKQVLEKVSAVEHESDVKTNAFLSGETTDLHDVMLTAQKAKITVEATVQIQQKVIDAYNDVMRMQI